MPAIMVNGITMHYLQKGTGTPLLLLHGLSSSSLTFEQEMHYLSRQFCVYALDARGHGLSDKPAAFTLEDHIEDTIAFMDAMAISKTHLLGVSMGSYIAQGIAARVPGRIEKLVLVAPKASGKTSSIARLLKEHAEELKGLSHEAKLNRISKYVYHNLRAIGQKIQQTAGRKIVLTARQEAAAARALENFDFRSRLSLINAHTLVVSGAHDGLNPPELGQEVAALISGAQYVEFAHSGHAPHVEEPEKFREILETFLRN